jgi:hypothetical protein
VAAEELLLQHAESANAVSQRFVSIQTLKKKTLRSSIVL